MTYTATSEIASLTQVVQQSFHSVTKFLVSLVKCIQSLLRLTIFQKRMWLSSTFQPSKLPFNQLLHLWKSQNSQQLAVTLPFSLKAEVTHQEVVDAIQAAGVKRLTDIKLFDVFSGEKLGLGMKSMAYSDLPKSRRQLNGRRSRTIHGKIQASLEEKSMQKCVKVSIHPSGWIFPFQITIQDQNRQLRNRDPQINYEFTTV